MNDVIVEVRVTSQLWWKEPANNTEESVLRKQQQQEVDRIVSKFNEPITAIIQRALGSFN